MALFTLEVQIFTFINRPFYRYGGHIEFIRGVLWDAQGALAQYLRALLGQKENFTVYSSGKRRSLLHPNKAQRSFFSHYNLFLGKLKEKLARKARVNTE